MKQEATFVGWDFDSIWDIIEEVSYPFLRRKGNYWNYNGFPLTTVQKGTVCGDVYISAGDHSGFGSSPYLSNFCLPAGVVKFARLYVGVQAESATWLDTVLNDEYQGIVALAKNGCLVPDGTNVYGSGNGVWLVAYNCTHKVNMATTNTAVAITGGEVYSIVLIVAYDDLDGAGHVTQYWINEGNMNLNSVTPLNSITTYFNGIAENTGARAKLSMVYLEGNQSEHDYLYFNRIEAYHRPNQLGDDGDEYWGDDDVAEGRDNSRFDISSFDVSNLIKPQDNFVSFWRVH
jgi:hypothetical protein